MLNHVVKCIPYLFSENMRLNSESYFAYVELYSVESNNLVRRYSLLSSRLNWRAKSVNSLTEISSKEAEKIRKWCATLPTPMPITRKTSSVLNSGLLSLPYFNMGRYRDPRSWVGLKEINFHSDHLKACNPFLITLRGGTTYLSVSWLLTDKATEIIKDVDVTDIPHTTLRYDSLNPWNKTCNSLFCDKQRTLAELRIIDAMDSLYRDIAKAEHYLYKTLDIKDVAEPVYTLDIHIDEKTPYFVNVESKHQLPDFDEVTEAHVIKRDEGVITFIYQENNYKCSLLRLGNLPLRLAPKIDNLYIESQVKGEIGLLCFNDFHHHVFNAMDSHHIFQFIFLVDKRFNELDTRFSHAMISTFSGKSDSTYKQISKVYLEICKLEELLHALLASKELFQWHTRSDRDYINVCMKKTKGHLRGIQKHKAHYKEKKQLMNELVQADNLWFQRAISVTVIVLTIVQVIIALSSSKLFESFFPD